MYTHVHAHTYTQSRLPICWHVFVHMYIYIHVHTYTQRRLPKGWPVFVHMYTHIHVHTNTYSRLPKCDLCLCRVTGWQYWRHDVWHPMPSTCDTLWHPMKCMTNGMAILTALRMTPYHTLTLRVTPYDTLWRKCRCLPCGHRRRENGVSQGHRVSRCVFHWCHRVSWCVTGCHGVS